MKPSPSTSAAGYRALFTDRKPKGKAIYALGRLKRGTMNGTEARFANYLELRKRVGEVAWWKFEGITLNLAKKTTLRVDFFVMLANGELQAMDVKGGPIEEDAAAKLKWANAEFPFRFFVVREIKGGGWSKKDVDDGL